jgi:hypothetical protein
VKTIKTANGSIMRVKDEDAAGLVQTPDYSYCPKDEWKKQEKLGKYKPDKKGN